MKPFSIDGKYILFTVLAVKLAIHLHRYVGVKLIINPSVTRSFRPNGDAICDSSGQKVII